MAQARGALVENETFSNSELGTTANEGTRGHMPTPAKLNPKRTPPHNGWMNFEQHTAVANEASGRDEEQHSHAAPYHGRVGELTESLDTLQV